MESPCLSGWMAQIMYVPWFQPIIIFHLHTMMEDSI